MKRIIKTIFKNKTKAKAFTMIELLICLVCVGFVCVGIGSMATTIKSYSTYISDREAAMLREYQDIMNLKSQGIEYRSQLNNSHYLRDPNMYNIGATFSMELYYPLDHNQQAIYEAADPNILSVAENGTCVARHEGVTYVKVEILTQDSEGVYRSNNETFYIPFIILSEEFQREMSSLKYYFYGGKYYVCWIYNVPKGGLYD